MDSSMLTYAANIGPLRWYLKIKVIRPSMERYRREYNLLIIIT